MTQPAPSHWPRPGALWIGASTLLVLGAIALAIGLNGHRVALASPPSIGRTHAPHAPAHAHQIARSRPVNLWIPAIGVASAVSRLGLNADGTVTVPTNGAVPGWFRMGPSPGQLGSAVILGHVDSFRGPAVFFRLRDLKLGDDVFVRLADHRTVRFVVIGTRMYMKSHFPDRLVYGKRLYSALQLVTCGGSFDSATGHYLSNVVVFTALAPRQSAA